MPTVVITWEPDEHADLRRVEAQRRRVQERAIAALSSAEPYSNAKVIVDGDITFEREWGPWR
jgi:hypothetical protein